MLYIYLSKIISAIISAIFFLAGYVRSRIRFQLNILNVTFSVKIW